MGAPYRVFWDWKVGNEEGEYEDAFSPPQTVDGALPELIAVADGATESSYSQDWARSLAEAFTSGSTRPGKPIKEPIKKLVKRLPALQADWVKSHRRSDLPWYAAQKLDLGAFAALLGVCIYQKPAGKMIKALAAGDCTLVIVRKGQAVRLWPIEKAADFSFSPALLASVGPAPEQMKLIKPMDPLALETDDLVFLMSDAIAAWFLGQAEAGERPWEILDGFGLGEDEAFRTWAREARTNGAMHNDDVTVAVVSIG